MSGSLGQPERALAVVGVGDADVDLYLEVARVPGPDEKILARSASRYAGGMVANFLVAVARLGLPCGFNGVVGDDEFGRFSLADLAANGVEIDAAVVRAGGSTYYCVVLLDPAGEKALVVAPTDCLFPRPDDVAEDAVRRARHVHTTAADVETALTAAVVAKGHRCSVSLDLEASVVADRARVAELVALTDVLFAGPAAARALTATAEPEEAAQRLLSLGPKIVCLTHGAAGSLVATATERVWTDADAVDVVDTTGAGDCFAAGFVYGFLARWPLARSARFATAVAALSVTRRGGHEGAPHLATVEAFLAVREGNRQHISISAAGQ